jgi:hypothetical protein
MNVAPPDLAAALRDPTTAAHILRALAEESGDIRYRRAAGMLSGARGCRPARDDDAALQRVAALLADGAARSIDQAARFVARTLAGETSTGAAEARLARKYRATKVVES